MPVHVLENCRLTKCSYTSTLPLNSQLFPETTEALELKEELQVTTFPKIAGFLNSIPANTLSWHVPEIQSKADGKHHLAKITT